VNMTTQSEIQALKCADCARSDSLVSDLRAKVEREAA